MSEGARVWLVPAGFIPAGSTGAQESYEAICVLNTTAEQARLSVFFLLRGSGSPQGSCGDRSAGPHPAHSDKRDGRRRDPARRAVRGRVEASVPVTVQCSRMDTIQAALSLMTARAYPVER